MLALAILSGDALFCTSGQAAPSSDDPVIAPSPATAQPPRATWRERWEQLFGAADSLPGPSAVRVATEPGQGFYGRPWNFAPAAPAGRGAWFAPAASAWTTRAGGTAFSSPGPTGPVTNNIYTAPGDYTIDSTDAPSNTFTGIGAGDSFTVGGSLQIGYHHTGSFSQIDGSVTVQSSGDGTGFVLGLFAGSSGTYTLIGGTLSAVNGYVGASGSGTMNHGAGTASFSNILFVGLGDGSNGTYNLSNTGSLNALYENIGDYSGSSGHFVQSGGTNTTQSLFLSQFVGGQGTYLLSAGTLTVSGGINVNNGTFTQTGGSASTGLLYLAYGDARAAGAYVMSGGTLDIQPNNAGANFVLGTFGSGTFTQTGGTVTDLGTSFDSNLILGFQSGASGTYHLDGGTLSVFGVRSQGGQSTFDFNGGTLQARADNGSFVTGLNTVRVRDGGAVIDTNGFNVTIPQTLTHSTVSGDNATDGGLTKVGSGTLTLTANNTYTGGTFINGGTLVPGSSGAISTGNITFGGGTLQFGTNSDYSARIKNSTGAISLDISGRIINFANALDSSNSGGLTKLGSGSLLLYGANTYTGTTTVSAGLLAVAGGSTGSLNSPLIVTGTSANNAQMYLTGGTLLASNEVIGIQGSGTFLQINGFSTNTVAGTLILGLLPSDTGTYSLGDGILQAAQVTGASSTSVFNFQGGVLRAGASDNPGDPTNPTTFFGGAFTANVRSYGAGINTNGFNVTIASNLLHSTIAGDNATDGGLTKLGAGTLTLAGNNTYNGGTFVYGGTLQGNTASLRGNIRDNANLVFNQTTDGTFASVISGDGTFTKMGAGTLTLTGNNTYTGSTNVRAGTLAITAGSTGSAQSNYRVDGTGATVNLSGGALAAAVESVGINYASVFNQSGGTNTVATYLLLGDFAGTSGTYNLNGGTLQTPQVAKGGTQGSAFFNFNGGTLQAGSDNAGFLQGLTTANVRNGGAVIDTNGHNVTVAQPLLHSTIAGDNATDGGLTKLGAGTLTLAGNNTYNGGTTLNAGTLVLGNGTNTAALRGTDAAAGTAVTVNNAATFQVQAQASVTGGSGAGGGNSGNAGSGGTGVNFNAGGTLTNTGTVSGGQGGNGFFVGGSGGTGVNFAGGGTLNNSGTVSGGNGGSGSFLGGSAGTGLSFSGGAGTLTNQQGGVINGGVSMDGNFANAVILQSGSTINGNLNVGTNAGSTLTLTDHGAGGSQLYSAAVTGTTSFNGALLKTGAGTWSLNQALSYAGGTTVAAGTLLANNASGSATGSGAVQVQSGATLGGGGTVGGNVVAQAGSTVAPGAASQLSTARLTLGGTLTLQGNSLLAIKLGGANGGSGYDQVFAGGGFTLGGNLQVSLVNGFVPTLNQSFTLLDNTGVGLNSGVFANAAGGLYTDAAGDTFLVNYVAVADSDLVPNDVTLTYLGTNVVPEPGTWACLLLGAGALVVRHARRPERSGKA